MKKDLDGEGAAEDEHREEASTPRPPKTEVETGDEWEECGAYNETEESGKPTAKDKK